MLSLITSTSCCWMSRTPPTNGITFAVLSSAKCDCGWLSFTTDSWMSVSFACAFYSRSFNSGA